jgi:hypothetical protein
MVEIGFLSLLKFTQFKAPGTDNPSYRALPGGGQRSDTLSMRRAGNSDRKTSAAAVVVSARIGTQPGPRPFDGMERVPALWRVPQEKVGRGWIEAPARIALPCRMGVGDGLNERSGCCPTGLAVRLQADLSIRSKRGCAGREPARMASVTVLVDR